MGIDLTVITHLFNWPTPRIPIVPFYYCRHPAITYRRYSSGPPPGVGDIWLCSSPLRQFYVISFLSYKPWWHIQTDNDLWPFPLVCLMLVVFPSYVHQFLSYGAFLLWALCGFVTLTFHLLTSKLVRQLQHALLLDAKYLLASVT